MTTAGLVPEDFEWNYFVTATFPWQTTRNTAVRTWAVFSSKLARISGLSANKSRQVGLPWAACVEETPSNQSHHIHALISGVSKEEIVKLWKSLFTKDARIDVRLYDSRRKAIAYIAKNGEILISKFFQSK